MTENVKLLFEVEDLRNASPATVVYFYLSVFDSATITSIKRHIDESVDLSFGL